MEKKKEYTNELIRLEATFGIFNNYFFYKYCFNPDHLCYRPTSGRCLNKDSKTQCKARGVKPISLRLSEPRRKLGVCKASAQWDVIFLLDD